MTFIDRSPLLAGLNYAKGQILYRLKLRRHDSGSTAYHLSLDEAVRYVRTVVADYVQYGAGGDIGRIQGTDILEIGPGDNLGVALLLLANGARTVTCIDGFAPKTNARHNARLNAAIYNSLTFQPDGTATVGGGRLIGRYGEPIDTDAVVLEQKRYDIIVSRAVLEHLGDLATGWRQMVRCLRPDGEMWHKVDFRCHNLFGRIHPLYFLTVP
jgi:SAM-dependent methyltransferase